MEEKIKQLKELFNQRDEIDNQIAEILGEREIKPAIKSKRKYAVKKNVTKKSLMKRWSNKYDKCQKCGTTKEPHECKGLCKKCYQILWLRKKKAKTNNELKDIETSSAGRKYKCEDCGHHFFSVADYLDVQCPHCSSTKALRLPK